MEFSERFFQNRACRYFPCHPGADPEGFNCLFCYCPLYLLGRDCGGNFKYLPSGVKSCEGCRLPHSPEGYDHVVEKYPLILAKLRSQERERDICEPVGPGSDDTHPS